MANEPASYLTTPPASRHLPEPAAAPEPGSPGSELLEETTNLLAGFGLITLSVFGGVPGFIPMLALCLAGAVIIVLPMMILAAAVAAVGGVLLLVRRAIVPVARLVPTPHLQHRPSETATATPRDTAQANLAVPEAEGASTRG